MYREGKELETTLNMHYALPWELVMEDEMRDEELNTKFPAVLKNECVYFRVGKGSFHSSKHTTTRHYTSTHYTLSRWATQTRNHDTLHERTP